MTRVLVISSQGVIAMTLQNEYDVTAVTRDELEPAVVERGYDVTVLDAADVADTVLLLTELPREHTGPVLLLAHDAESALALDQAKGLNDLRIGPPISGAALRDQLHGIAHGPAAPPVAHLMDADAVGPSVRHPVPAGLRREQTEIERRLQGLPQQPNLERAGTPADLLSLSQGLTRHAPPPPVGDKPRRQARHVDMPTELSTASLVAALFDRVPSMLGLNVIARAVAEDACQRVSGTASAVLITDGELCVVAAGVGLRPLELRLQLDVGHWLMRQVVRGGHGVIVEGTDVMRGDLMGAPLAAAEHLLVVPVALVGGLLMVGRDSRGVAFTSRELASVSVLASEAAEPLREALQLRDLARTLMSLDDPD